MNSLEAIMMISFGAAWPVSIYKSYRSKSIEGKSIAFLFIILLGYIAGIFNKLFNSNDLVIYLYILNAAMVLIDIILYYVNKNHGSAECIS